MITPSDIRLHTFSKTLFRGLDPDEVKAFLNSLAGEVEDLQSQNQKNKKELADATERLHRTEERLRSFEEMEAFMHKTLQQAEQATRDTLTNAQKDAALKLQEAGQKANEILAQAYRERNKVEQEIQQLTLRRNDMLAELKLFFASQIEKVKSMEKQRAAEERTETQPAFAETRQPAAPPAAEPVFVQPANKQPVVMQPNTLNRPAVSQPAAYAPVAPTEDGSYLLREQRSFFDQLKKTPAPDSVSMAIANEL